MVSSRRMGSHVTARHTITQSLVQVGGLPMIFLQSICFRLTMAGPGPATYFFSDIASECASIEVSGSPVEMASSVRVIDGHCEKKFVPPWPKDHAAVWGHSHLTARQIATRGVNNGLDQTRTFCFIKSLCPQRFWPLVCCRYSGARKQRAKSTPVQPA